MPGLFVDSTTPDGNAAKAGIQRNDVLYKYNDTLLSTTEDLIAATSSDKAENKLLVIRGWAMLNLAAAPGPLGLTVQPYPVQDVHIEGVDAVLARYRRENEQETPAQKAEREAVIAARIAGLQVTTTPQLEGYRVAKTLGIITAEYVGGMNLFRDFLAGITDLVGGRSGSMQNELRTARETCITNLKIEADRLGANAVIGVALDYSEISGGGKSMLFLVASGTAVVVEKIESA